MDHTGDQPEATSSSCNCFGSFPCFGQRGRGSDAARLLEYQEKRDEHSWWVAKAREWSEVVAGPKWKNFIRKIGSWRNQRRRRCNDHVRFQYDSFDYALNFDDQHQRGDHADPDHLPYTFSARFTAPRAMPTTTPQIST